MSAAIPDMLELLKSVANPERAAEMASGLGRGGQGELISQVAKLSHLIDRFFIHAFVEGSDGALKKALEAFSNTLEELRDALITSSPWASVGENVLLCLSSMIMRDVERDIERLMASGGEEGVEEVEEARSKLEEVSGLLKSASSIGPSSSPRAVLGLVRRLLPEGEELASYLMVTEVLKGLSREKDFYKALAEVIASWFSRSGRARGGCVRPADVRAWASDVLRVKVADKDVERALRLLKERGDILEARSKKGIFILRPREEDVEKALELARERYREVGSGVSAHLLSQRFGWCLEYASALIDELVRRRWLFPGPSKLMPGTEEYYPPPEG